MGEREAIESVNRAINSLGDEILRLQQANYAAMKNYDELIRTFYSRIEILEKENRLIRRQLEIMPCGHPRCALADVSDFPGDKPGDLRTVYCRWCADKGNKQ